MLITPISLYAAEIHTAAGDGDLQKVKDLLDADATLLNAKDDKGWTPLHSAVSKGRAGVVEYLLAQGGDTEMKNNNGLTPLFQALDLSRNRVAGILIDRGADITVRGYRNRTILHMAARAGNATIVQLLLAKGAEVNARDSRGSTPLDLAVASNKPQAAKILLSSGAETRTFTTENEESQELLNRAVHLGQYDTIQLVHSVGGSLDWIDEFGRSLLHKAAAYGRLEIAELLLKNGLSPDAATKNGLTPLRYARKYGHTDLINLLMSKGASKGNSFYDPGDINQLLHETLDDKEAYIWYLNHSSWAVKTARNLLIFDYVEEGQTPAHCSLGSGYINPEELRDIPVTVFVSHGHDDHYDPDILRWRNSIRSIHYVFGFQPRGVRASDYIYFAPRERRSLGDISVTTIKSTDAGVGFLVEADGLTIYHAGDHANRFETLPSPYHEEVDYLADKYNTIDLAFILAGEACGGGYGQCVLEGDFYAIRTLSPRLTFPMHSGGNEHVYKHFAADAAAHGISAKIAAAEFRGDRFYYRGSDTVY